jgi:hypothetical protein
MATCAGFEPAIFSVTGRYAKPLHQQAWIKFKWAHWFCTQ